VDSDRYFLLIILNPLQPNQGWGRYIFNLLLFIIASGILAASDERQIIRQITVIGGFVVALDWITTLARQYLPRLMLLVYALYALVIGLITVAIILTIIKSSKVTANIICGAIAGYLFIGLSGAFIALDSLNPGSFLAGGELQPGKTRRNWCITAWLAFRPLAMAILPPLPPWLIPYLWPLGC
jgi:hypothetical protein